jgi:hypothetical protein
LRVTCPGDLDVSEAEQVLDRLDLYEEIFREGFRQAGLQEKDQGTEGRLALRDQEAGVGGRKARTEWTNDRDMRQYAAGRVFVHADGQSYLTVWGATEAY